jgi:hypothetical protein
LTFARVIIAGRKYSSNNIFMALKPAIEKDIITVIGYQPFGEWLADGLPDFVSEVCTVLELNGMNQIRI